MEPLTDGNISALIYEPDGSSLDILATSKLVLLEGSCVGIERPDGTQFIAAFPRGTTLEDSQIQVNGMNPVQVGGDITYTGSVVHADDAAQRGIIIPDQRATAAKDIWLILPANL